MNILEYFKRPKCETCGRAVNFPAWLFGVRKCAGCVKKMYEEQTAV